jgi:chromosome segregation ATPase
MENETDYRAGRARRADFPRAPETDRVDPNLTLDQLNERRAIISEQLSEINHSIDSIKGQLEDAELTETRSGVPTNPDWLRRARSAQRYFKRQHQDHQRALGNLNRRAAQLGQSSNKQVNRKLFIWHARNILPPETYDAIWAKVEAELSGGAERAA